MQSTKKPIRILFISHLSGLAGAERSLLLLLSHLNKNKYKSLVILPKKGEIEKEIKKLNIKTQIIYIPWWVGSKKNIIFNFIFLLRCLLLTITSSFKLCRIIKNEEIDLIYTNTITTVSGAIAAFITNKPHIWHIREIMTNNSDLSFYINRTKVFKIITNRSAKIITNSKATANQFCDFYSKEKIEVIYNAVNIDLFKTNFTFPNIKEVNPKDWIILVIGYLNKMKAQDDAIYALKNVSEKIPNIKLLLIGQGNNEFQKYLYRIISNLGIENKVIFTGFRNDIPAILNHCKVLLVPSLNEAFGRVVIEAMAAGIPVIGVNRGGMTEIIKDGVTGYLVPPKSPMNIAEKLIYLFRNPNIAKDMGSTTCWHKCVASNQAPRQFLHYGIG